MARSPILGLGLLLGVGLGGAGCSPAPGDTPSSDTDEAEDSGEVVDSGAVDTGGPPSGSLETWQLLTRWSLDLRGVRPEPEVIEAIEADPELLLPTFEAWLGDEALGERVMDMWAEVYLTRTEYYPVLIVGYGPAESQVLWRSVGDEPLQVLAHIVTEDLPWTELTQGDWTMADETLATYWPVEYPEGATGWQVSRYTDGRPRVGVMASNGLWWRYSSTLSNANRGRANAVSRILLCDNFLERPISFDAAVDLLDEEAVLNAIQNEPACVACHVSLDPLASNFWGFYRHAAESALEGTYYNANRELWWVEETGTAPGFYGTPTESLEHLGQLIAADSRFVDCAVEQTMELLLHRPLELADHDAWSTHRDTFIEGGAILRPLLASVMTDPSYLGDEGSGGPGLKLVTPALLSSQVEELTGYVLEREGQDLLESDLYGVRILAGGIDGYSVRSRQRQAGPTLLMVQRALAEEAAWVALDRERALDPGERRLFVGIELESTELTSAEREAHIARLHRAVLGRAATAEELTDLDALWLAMYAAEGGPEGAWAALASALMQDPTFLLY